MATSPRITIAGRDIGPDMPPYVIAEMSGNHNGELARAFEIIEAAKDSGADALKMQTYTPDTITIKHDGPGFTIEGTAWEGRTLHDLYDEAHTPYDWHEKIFEKARSLGIPIFSSPFDFTAIELLERLGAPAYKIASFEMVDIPLIDRAASTGKPLVISTGLANLEEIGEAIAAARRPFGQSPAILHCISSYPTEFRDCNLSMIPLLAKEFGTVVGFSDHTPGTAGAVAAVALGACIIEKHLTLSRADGGPDAAFSLEPQEFRKMVDDCRSAFVARGKGGFVRPAAEDELRVFRRSLYVVEDVAAGESFTASNVRSIRPNGGLPPKYLPQVIGKKAAASLKRGTPLSWDAVRN